MAAVASSSTISAMSEHLWREVERKVIQVHRSVRKVSDVAETDRLAGSLCTSCSSLRGFVRPIQSARQRGDLEIEGNDLLRSILLGPWSRRGRVDESCLKSVSARFGGGEKTELTFDDLPIPATPSNDELDASARSFGRRLEELRDGKTGELV